MGNAIDWLSRWTPTSPLRDKPIAIMGAARGGGSVRAQASLRVPLVHARAAVLDGPVVVLYNIDELATETGDLVDLEARQGVANLVSALANAVRRHVHEDDLMLVDRRPPRFLLWLADGPAWWVATGARQKRGFDCAHSRHRRARPRWPARTRY